MKPFKKLDIKSEITYLKHIENRQLAVVSRNNIFRILDEHSLKQNYGFKSKSAQIDKFSKTAIISQNGNFSTYTDNEQGSLTVIYLPETKILGKCHRHHGPITCCAIDPDGIYMATGGEDGKVFLFSADDAEYLLKLPSHPDYVSEIGFSPDGSFLVSCAYDGTIVITKISTESKPMRYKPFEHQKINSLAFLPDFKLAAGNDRGEVAIIDYLKLKPIARLHFEMRPITGIDVSYNERFLYVSQMGGQVALASLETFKVITSKLLVLEQEITSIASSPHTNTLAVANETGTIFFYELHDDKELKELIDNSFYAKAYELVDITPLLMTTKEYARLEKIWKKAFDNTIKLLGNRKPEEAESLIAPFRDVPGKTAEINQLMRDFQEYDKLDAFIKSKNYTAAYSLVQHAKYLNRSVSFINLEKIWRDRFKEAEELVLKYNKTDVARKLLEDFYRIPAKAPVIHNLLRNRNLFLDMIMSLREKDFKTFFRLTMKHKFLKDTPEYENVIEYGEHLLESIRYKIEKRRYKDVLVDIQHLMHFRHLKDEIDDIRGFATTANNFLTLYNAKNIEKCYMLIDHFPILMGFQEAKKLEANWRRLVYQAEKSASEGDIPSIRTTFEKYFHMASRNKKIGSLFKKAYLAQLRGAILDKNNTLETFEKATHKYITMFGYDEEIEEFLVKLKKETRFDLMLGTNETNKKKETDWYFVTKGNVPDNILTAANSSSEKEAGS